MDPSKTSNSSSSPTLRNGSTDIVPYRSSVPARTPAYGATPDALAMLKALHRRWTLALGMGVALAVLIGSIVWLVVPKAKYTANSTLQVATNPQRIVFDPRNNSADAKTYQKTQLALLTNRYVLGHALIDPSIAGLPTIREQVDAEDWLESHLKATFPGGSEVLDVSLSGDRPTDLAKIVNAVVESYMLLIVQAEHKDQLDRLEMLKKLWDKYEQELKLKRKSLKELAASVGSDNPQTLALSQQFKSGELNLAQGELMRAQADLMRAKAELATMEAAPAGSSDKRTQNIASRTALDAEVESEVERHPEIRRLKEQMDEHRKTYEAMAKATSDRRDARLLAARTKWEEVYQALASLRDHTAADLRRARQEQTTERVNPPAEPKSDDRIDALVDVDPEVVKRKAVLDDLDEKYKKVNGIVVRKADPALKHALAKREMAQGALGRERDRVRGLIRSKLEQGLLDLRPTAPAGSPAGESSAMGAVRLKAHTQVVEGYRSALIEQIGRIQKELKDMNDGGLDLESHREAILIATEFAHKVGSEVEFLRVEINAPKRIRVLAPAKVPKSKDEYRKLKAGGIAAIASFGLGLFGVAFWEFRARRIDGADDVTMGIGLHLVGSLPPHPIRAWYARTLTDDPQRRWQSRLVESIDATRAMLMHACRAHSVRVVMVTSALKGEGKTSVSSHLAASLARGGCKTLLVDCDLRNPSLHTVLDLPLGAGLCDVLRGEVAVHDAIQPTGASGLDFLAAGELDSGSLRALSQNQLHSLFEDLKRDYDFVIVDSAPVLLVSDSLQIGQNVDGVLISVLRHVSRQPQVQAAHERLSILGVTVLGAVVSGVQTEIYNPYDYANA
jgi:capsular exopolysaccharide synthesis family protein